VFAILLWFQWSLLPLFVDRKEQFFSWKNDSKSESEVGIFIVEACIDLSMISLSVAGVRELSVGSLQVHPSCHEASLLASRQLSIRQVTV